MIKLPRVENDEDGFGVHQLHAPNSIEHTNLIDALRKRQAEYDESMLRLQNAIARAKDLRTRIADLKRHNQIQ